MKKLALWSLLFIFGKGVGYSDDVANAVIIPFGTLSNYDSPLVISNEKAQDLLNVDISPQGKSVKKREGFAQAFALTYTTSATHGVYKFYDSSGNEVSLFFNDTQISASIGGVQPSVISSGGPNGATYQCVDSQGFAYCNNTTRTSLIKTDGVTVSNVSSVNSTGTLVAVTPDRLVTSGFSGAPNRIDFSGSADFTRWIAPFSAGTDPNQITITAPGSKITHIVYAFNRLIWFKDNSFGYVLFGSALLDWQVRTVSPVVGTLDNSSIYWNDVLYWRGQDGHYYSYDGASIERMSRDITDTILQAQSRVANSWTQTNLSDWQAGISTPPFYANLNRFPGSITLDTATAISPFTDTLTADFVAGTLTNISTSVASNAIALSLGAETARNFFYPSDNSFTNDCNPGDVGWLAQSFTAASSYVVTSATLRLMRQGAGSGNYTISIYSDAGSGPDTQLTSVVIPGSSVLTTTTNFIVPISSQSLVMSTTYWLRFDYPTGCSNSAPPDRVMWMDGIADGSNPLVGVVRSHIGIVGGPPLNQNFKSNGKQFSTTGNIVSRSFDVGFTTNTWLWEWRELTSSGTIPSGGTITYQTQTSSASTGPFDSLVTVSTETNPISTSTVRQFIRYKASFTTSFQSTSPILTDVFINMSKRIRPGVTFYSQVNPAPNLTAWNTFSADTNGLGTYTYSVRGASNSITILSSSPTFVSVLSGAIPNIAVSTRMQVQAIVTTTSPFVEPSLDAFTLNWFEGLASDKAYGGYFDYALWWNVQLGTGAAYNNYVVKYDMINNGFTIYDIPMNGFYVRGGSLYFGSSTGGYIYKYGGVNNDNGSAINAYWKSKDFINGEGPFNDDEYVRLSLLTTSVQNSSMTVTYELNGNSETSFVMPLYTPTSDYRYRNLNLPTGKTATTFNLKFGNNATEQPFELFAIQYGYREKPWIPHQ